MTRLPSRLRFPVCNRATMGRLALGCFVLCPLSTDAVEADPTPRQAAQAAALARPNGQYLITHADSLPMAKTQISAGNTGAKAALDLLLLKAAKALKVRPQSVVAKSEPAPSGSLHDYVSIAPYFWPDPAQPDGLPWIPHDGRVNPIARSGDTDPSRAARMRSAVRTLALAYYFTQDERYADHAASCLRAWFLDPQTAMTPHLEYAQGVPGKSNGRPIGIIEAGNLVDPLDAAGLLIGSPAWTAQDEQALDDWRADFLEWLLTSDHGKREARMPQNHGTMYDVHVVRLALMLGREHLARERLAAVRSVRIARQIEPDGSQPRELRRTKSFNYSRLNLRGLMTLGVLGERVGVDLWSYTTDDGRGIRPALDFLVPYLGEHRQQWPYEQITPYPYDDLAPMLRTAAIAYDHRPYNVLAEELVKPSRGLYTLLAPLPPGLATADSPPPALER